MLTRYLMTSAAIRRILAIPSDKDGHPCESPQGQRNIGARKLCGKNEESMLLG